MKTSFNYWEIIELVAKESSLANCIVVRTKYISDKMYEKISKLLEKEQFNDLVAFDYYVMEYKDVTWKAFSDIVNDENEYWLYLVKDKKLTDYC